jgi:hypothetical protein
MKKSLTLQLLSFDGKSTFDIFALFEWIKRASIYPPNKEEKSKVNFHQKITIATSEGSVFFSLPVQI